MKTPKWTFEPMEKHGPQRVIGNYTINNDKHSVDIVSTDFGLVKFKERSGIPKEYFTNYPELASEMRLIENQARNRKRRIGPPIDRGPGLEVEQHGDWWIK